MIIQENIHQQITGAGDIAKILQSILALENEIDQDKEHFWAIGLNTHNIINYIELVTLGLLNQSLIHARELYRLAIIKSCSSIIIAHNHPSGNLTPSEQDKIISRNLSRAGEILDIKILDHIIISKTDFYSFKAKGLF